MSPDAAVGLDRLTACFDGAIPAVLATASARGVPNVTYLSKVHRVDAERIALSNQFLSKSARNLVENPRASLLIVAPETQDEYRLTLVFERTERRGPVFDRLRTDVEHIAAITGMQDVFRLHAADIFRVLDVEPVRVHGDPARDREDPGAAGLAELCVRLGRCTDLDTLVRTAVDGLADLLGHEHGMLMLADEDGGRLFTIASHGYPAEGVGSEVAVGDGLIGMAAAQCATVRVGNLRQMARYARIVREGYEEAGDIGPGREIPVPGMEDANSRMAVPAMALGNLVGVLVVESGRAAAFGESDASRLQVVASLLGGLVESIRAEERAVEAVARVTAAQAEASPPAPPVAGTGGSVTHVRFFPVDGSCFLDGDYLIKGVAGRLLWSLLRQHQGEGRVDFTNREVRLDPTLDLPDFRDNFESRLILLKRRLDERDASVRIEKTGRGRFRLDVRGDVRLEAMDDPG